ncbi:MAG: CidA/LrgA family protein, partial [Desulfuromonadaceae bacterium]|nr:CidA/LrgA family protein [Desulfuromonadaceae bacterium]
MAILLGLQLVGELITYVLKLPLPGSVVGMLLLLAGLRGGILRVDWVKEAAELLLRNLSLLFVPAGVGVMVYAGLIAQHWLPLTLAASFSTLAVLAATGWSAQLLARRQGAKGDK